ncbi:putative transmembrane protein [Buchnera aphidicola (Cinara tujafilina)]|uniref:Putative transmembrane protein n=1 Tax=Buchnera aphidicola (Cinara tujafilina) TaxID=261317 RepID=F7WZB0_9GAMM|nr:DMT family transporter [Buchnera aphidicola]AEH39769.1 putative transmembrane protein [Buchnera aphidicola (Cinara tujafilina)]
MWGTTWIAMKIVITTIPPIFATGLRFLIIAPLSMVTAWFSDTPLLFPVGQRIMQIYISIFYFSIPFTLMLYGGRYVNVPTASLIFSGMPIISLLISYIIFNELINSYQFIGMSIYFISLIFFLLLQWKSSHIHQELGVLLLFISLICQSIIFIYFKKKFNHISVLSFNSIPSLISGILLIIFGWNIEHPVLNNFSMQSMCAICYLSVFVGFLGTISYLFLQKKIDSCYASIVFIIFPIVSLFLDRYMYMTKVSNFEYFFIMFLLFSVIITLFTSKKNICLIKKITKQRFNRKVA